MHLVKQLKEWEESAGCQTLPGWSLYSLGKRQGGQAMAAIAVQSAMKTVSLSLLLDLPAVCHQFRLSLSLKHTVKIQKSITTNLKPSSC
ncbi:hypothetical protein ILYODFUR_020719 [Ilyodon furcidens]|uniref:Uncharacterized protein n=1 Tax=Ilyodon furcidens TaxID=33524 RepID=A0ABV0TDL4_9TELE